MLSTGRMVGDGLEVDIGEGSGVNSAAGPPFLKVVSIGTGANRFFLGERSSAIVTEAAIRSVLEEGDMGDGGSDAKGQQVL